jgi:hypothetical protein
MCAGAPRLSLRHPRAHPSGGGCEASARLRRLPCHPRAPQRLGAGSARLARRGTSDGARRPSRGVGPIGGLPGAPVSRGARVACRRRRFHRAKVGFPVAVTEVGSGDRARRSGGRRHMGPRGAEPAGLARGLSRRTGPIRPRDALDAAHVGLRRGEPPADRRGAPQGLAARPGRQGDRRLRGPVQSPRDRLGGDPSPRSSGGTLHPSSDGHERR